MKTVKQLYEEYLGSMRTQDREAVSDLTSGDLDVLKLMFFHGIKSFYIEMASMYSLPSIEDERAWLTSIGIEIKDYFRERDKEMSGDI